MANMVRKQIYIEPEQDELLKQIADESGLSEAEIIQGAINRYAAEVAQPLRSRQAWARIKAFLAKRMEGAEQIDGGRTWRREDLHDR
jgi:hypothetical protein